MCTLDHESKTERTGIEKFQRKGQKSDREGGRKRKDSDERERAKIDRKNNCVK